MRERRSPQKTSSYKITARRYSLNPKSHKRSFEPKYIGDYRVVSLKGNQVEIQPTISVATEMKHVKHVKYILPADRYINQLPSYA